jgi:hypothetical protein
MGVPYYRRPFMSLRVAVAPIVALCLAFAAASRADEQAAPDGKSKVGKLPHVTFDVKARQVRVEAEALDVDAPLEFFCVLNNTAEHEAVVRSPAKPSHIHTALLAIGLKPGRPVTYSEALRKWSPPQGPPLQVIVEWDDAGGKRQSVPAYRLMRDVKSKKTMPALTWVFVGSRQMEDGTYAADTTGYIISVVNFDLTLIDIPELASNANEALEWQRNPDLAPPRGTKLTLLIEPAGNKAAAAPAVGAAVPQAPPAPAESAAAAADVPAPPPPPPAPAAGLSEVQIDERRMKRLREYWLKAVRPNAAALQKAAQAHYDVMTALRREQQRLIDEADRLQRAMDELEKEYQGMTTPHPPDGAEPARKPEEPAPAPDPAEPGPFGQ